MAVALLALAASACSGPDPIERARLAAGRAPASALPPVPGEDQAYPNLGSVPARPATIPPAERRALEDALVADRANARYVGQALVPTVPRPAPAPAPAAAAPPPAPMEAAGSMLMGAEEQSPPPLGAPAVPPPAGAPITAAALPAPPAGSPPPRPEGPAAPEPAAFTMEAFPPPPAPAMPEELPARARAGAEALATPAPTPVAPPAPAAPSVPEPAAAAPPLLLPPETPQPTAAAVPPATAPQPSPSPAPPPMPAPPAATAPAPPQPAVVVDRSALLGGRTGPQVQAYALSFLPGTQTLVPQDRAVVAGLAARGTGATFRVTGFSDEAGTGRALDVPLARARAVADALRAAGVPAEAIELGGAARQGPAGRGAEVRLVYSR